ncbi:MAG: DUF2974 domain-containing protein [Bacilli bacterium]|nr:DUF2974 domain-containing protein [Bacilli bacterium]
MSNGINLENLNDLQKSLLTQISYLNINDEGREKILNSGISVSELSTYLANPDDMFVGDDLFDNNVTHSVVDKVVGDKGIITHKELVDCLIENGLSYIFITNISNKKGTLTNGFQALTFVDSYGNTGISYRGSDFNLTQGGINDWLEADVLEYFTGSSSQVREALKYFEDNKNSNGNNYLYGHSLGGNLTSHTYLHNHDEIREAFTVNGNPINQKLLDTPEKVEAFNDPEKYHCNVIGGDIVGHFKSCSSYRNNVKYIHNNGQYSNTPVSAYMIQAAEFDENGNFVVIDEKEMVKEMGLGYALLMTFSQGVREILNTMERNIAKDEYRKMFELYRVSLLEHLDTLEKKFGNTAPTLNDSDNLVLIDEFHAAALNNEKEFIETISKYLGNNIVGQDIIQGSIKK